MLQSLIFNLRKTPVKIENALGVPYVTKSAVFFNIVQTAVDPPPPFVLNIAERIFFDGYPKKRVNVCRDIIWQNNA